MKKRLILFLLISIISFPVLTNAESIVKTIVVTANPFDIYIKGQPLTTEHFVYNDTTYVPLRAISEDLNMDVQWDSQNNMIEINQKSITRTDSKYPEYISLINLIATPDKYHGKYIEVTGYFCILDFESYGLFLSAEDARNYISKNSVLVDFKTGGLSNGIDFSEPVLVRIEGIFNQYDFGDIQKSSIDNAEISLIYSNAKTEEICEDNISN